jgi:hypothetical protein
VIARADLLRAANREHAPSEILRGHYRAIATDERHETVIYGRTEVPVDQFKRDPTQFLENLAHVSRLRRVVLNDQVVSARDYLRLLPWSHTATGRLHVQRTYTADLTFDTVDQPVYELHVDEVMADRRTTLQCILTDAAGLRHVDQTIEVPSGQSRDLRMRFAGSIPARRLTIVLTAQDGPAVVLLTDVRVQGHTPALARYVRENVRFASTPR